MGRGDEYVRQNLEEDIPDAHADDGEVEDLENGRDEGMSEDSPEAVEEEDLDDDGEEVDDEGPMGV